MSNNFPFHLTENVYRGSILEGSMELVNHYLWPAVLHGLNYESNLFPTGLL